MLSSELRILGKPFQFCYVNEVALSKRTNSSDPLEGKPITNALKRLVSEKITTPLCAGLSVFVTTNLTGSQIPAAMRRRADFDYHFSKPNNELRRKMLELTIKKSLKTNGLKSLNLKDFEPYLTECADIGNADLL